MNLAKCLVSDHAAFWVNFSRLPALVFQTGFSGLLLPVWDICPSYVQAC